MYQYYDCARQLGLSLGEDYELSLNRHLADPESEWVLYHRLGEDFVLEISDIEFRKEELFVSLYLWETYRGEEEVRESFCRVPRDELRQAICKLNDFVIMLETQPCSAPGYLEALEEIGRLYPSSRLSMW